MKLSMFADFRLYKNIGNGEYRTMSEKEIRPVNLGGFCFNVGGKNVPFTFDSFSIIFEKDNIFSLVSGRGETNDYALSSAYDEQYREIGIKKSDISAAYLGSANRIEEFYLNIEDNSKIYGVGLCSDNGKVLAPYKIELLEVSFEDISTGKFYTVDPEVLAAFNKGDKGPSLDDILADATRRSNEMSGGGKTIEFEKEM